MVLHPLEYLGQSSSVLRGGGGEGEALARVSAQVENNRTEVAVMSPVSGGDVLHPGPGTVVDPFLQLLHWSRPGPEMSLTSVDWREEGGGGRGGDFIVSLQSCSALTANTGVVLGKVQEFSLIFYTFLPHSSLQL